MGPTTSVQAAVQCCIALKVLPWKPARNHVAARQHEDKHSLALTQAFRCVLPFACRAPDRLHPVSAYVPRDHPHGRRGCHVSTVSQHDEARKGNEGEAETQGSLERPTKAGQE